MDLIESAIKNEAGSMDIQCDKYPASERMQIIGFGKIRTVFIEVGVDRAYVLCCDREFQLADETAIKRLAATIIESFAIGQPLSC